MSGHHTSTLLYFVVIAATMMGLSRLGLGLEVEDWVAALIAAVVLALVNAVVKPVLFILTLPFTILTLGLFLLVLNALMLWLTSALVPGFHVHGLGGTLLASIILSFVGMVWKAATRKAG
ncbi:MAG: phage holin family protein [Candidatus Eisenbacteria bacterium]|nr:phage holin family protein [Candidatus Eisenbacteria bacterium]